MNEAAVLILIICVIVLALWVGKLRAESEDDSESDVKDGKVAEADARAQIAKEEATLAEKSAAVEEQIDDALSETTPGAERIRARWDLLHKNPYGGPSGPGNHSE